MILTIIVFILSFFLVILDVNAQVMSNNDYKIIWGHLNSGAGSVTGDNYKLNTTIGQVSPGLYSGTNYKVRAGFQYIRITTPFSFTITPTLIDFGIATPNNPITRTSSLSVSTGASSGYSVVVSADRQLTSAEGNVIPATTCDNGTCSYINASAWTSSLTYGFGYRCDNVTGTDCDSGFTASSSYKSFTASSSGVSVMSSSNARNKKRSAQVTYKVNISPPQPAGVYTNTLTYIAAPGF